MRQQQQERIFKTTEGQVNELLAGLGTLSGEVTWAKVNPFIVHIRNMFVVDEQPKKPETQELKSAPATETTTGVNGETTTTETVTESSN